MYAVVFLYVNQHTKFQMPSFTSSKDMFGAKFKKGHVTMTTPIRGQSVTARLALHIIYLRTKLGNYRFSRSGYVTAGIEIENGLYDPNYAPFRGGLSSVS